MKLFCTPSALLKKASSQVFYCELCFFFLIAFLLNTQYVQPLPLWLVIFVKNDKSYTERLDVNYAVAYYHWIYFFDYKKKMPVKV